METPWPIYAIGPKELIYAVCWCYRGLLMQLTLRSCKYFRIFPSHEWQKSGRFYGDLRNKSSRETCVLSASTTIILYKFDELAWLRAKMRQTVMYCSAFSFYHSKWLKSRNPTPQTHMLWRNRMTSIKTQPTWMGCWHRKAFWTRSPSGSLTTTCATSSLRMAPDASCSSTVGASAALPFALPFPFLPPACFFPLDGAAGDSLPVAPWDSTWLVCGAVCRPSAGEWTRKAFLGRSSSLLPVDWRFLPRAMVEGFRGWMSTVQGFSRTSASSLGLVLAVRPEPPLSLSPGSVDLSAGRPAVLSPVWLVEVLEVWALVPPWPLSATSASISLMSDPVQARSLSPVPSAAPSSSSLEKTMTLLVGCIACRDARMASSICDSSDCSTTVRWGKKGAQRIPLVLR